MDSGVNPSRSTSVTRATTVWMIDSLGATTMPVMASWPLGTMFHHVGTAATQ